MPESDKALRAAGVRLIKAIDSGADGTVYAATYKGEPVIVKITSMPREAAIVKWANSLNTIPPGFYPVHAIIPLASEYGAEWAIVRPDIEGIGKLTPWVNATLYDMLGDATVAMRSSIASMPEATTLALTDLQRGADKLKGTLYASWGDDLIAFTKLMIAKGVRVNDIQNLSNVGIYDGRFVIRDLGRAITPRSMKPPKKIWIAGSLIAIALYFWTQ
jgi:hypothetical protein